jgi:hypothetical protein
MNRKRKWIFRYTFVVESGNEKEYNSSISWASAGTAACA